MKKERFIKLRFIKNSIVVIGGADEKNDALEKAVKAFDMADKTPLDCFDFLRMLKSLLK